VSRLINLAISGYRNNGSSNVTKLSSGSPGVLVPLVENLPQTTDVNVKSISIAGGTPITAQTGTGGTMVMSDSPTLTGNLTVPTVNGAHISVFGTSNANIGGGLPVTEHWNSKHSGWPIIHVLPYDWVK